MDGLQEKHFIFHIRDNEIIFGFSLSSFDQVSIHYSLNILSRTYYMLSTMPNSGDTRISKVNSIYLTIWRWNRQWKNDYINLYIVIENIGFCTRVQHNELESQKMLLLTWHLNELGRERQMDRGLIVGKFSAWWKASCDRRGWSYDTLDQGVKNYHFMPNFSWYLCL